jgi:hypothetical protein
VTAREALRLARHTVTCGLDGAKGAVPSVRCQFMQPGDEFELWSRDGDVQNSWDNSVAHLVTASLLLDGLSVDDVTEAGG